MVHCGLYPSHGALIKTCLKELIKEVCLLRVLGHGTLAWVDSPGTYGTALGVCDTDVNM